MPTQYYINRNDKVRGPFSEGRIRDLYAEGKLRDEDLVRTGDKGDWQRLDDVLVSQRTKFPKPSQPANGVDSPAKKKSVLVYGVATACVVTMLAGTWLFFGSDSSDPGPLPIDPPESAIAAARPDIVFEDFEGTDFANWTVQGTSFGTRPYAPASNAHAKNSLMTPVNGRQVADSFFGSDFVESHELTGKLISPAFTIERNYINFWIAGGEEGAAQAVLRIDGNVQRTSIAQNKARILQPLSWDVSEFLGKTAVIEIVDESKKPGGHLCVDSFVFSDADFSSKNLELVSQAVRDAAQEWNGRRYYFSTMKIPFIEARQFASQVGGHLLCLESAEETGFICRSLTENVWLGIENKDGTGSWIGPNRQNYTHGTWRDGAPEYFHQQFAVVNPAGLWQDVRSPEDANLFVIEFGDSQSPTPYSLDSPAENRRAAELLQEKKCAFGVVTNSAYHWATSNTPLLIEDFELRDIRFAKGTSLSPDEVELFKEVKGITRLDLDACDDSVLEILKYTPQLRCVGISAGQYQWSALKYLQPGHPMRSFGLNRVTVTAEQLRPIFQAAALNHFAITGMVTSPEVADLLLLQKATLQHLGFNGVSGLGKTGIKKLGELTQLQSALFWGIGIDDETLPAIGRLHNLTTIQLGANQGIAGKSLASLAGLTKLDSIGLWSTGLNDEGLQNLPTLPSLKSITVGSTQVTDASIGVLAQQPQIRSVSIDGTAVTSAGLEKLRSRNSINHVVCAGSKVSKQAVDDFGKDRAEFRTDLKAENPAVAAAATAAASDKSGPSSAKHEEAIAKAPDVPAPTQTGNPAVLVVGAERTDIQADFPCQQAIAECDSRPDYGPLKTEMNRRIRNLRSLLTEAGVPEALIVAGKIELPETEAENVDASIAMQCEVFWGGYFITALGEVTRPLFVVANGYLPTEIRIPAATELTDNVIHIAPIALQPVTKSNESFINGNISLRPPGPMSQIHISFEPVIESKFNLPDVVKSIENLPALNPAFRVTVSAVSRDGSFRKNEVSPMPHRIVARCFGYEVGESRFDGKRLTPENLFLEVVPKYLLETLHATEKSSDNKSVAFVSQSSSILDGKWFKISRRSPKEVGATTLIIEPSRRELQWAALDSSSSEKPWKQVSSLTTVEFTKEEVIEIGRSYFVRGTENKDDRIIFTMTAPPAVEVAKSIQEIAVDKLPAQFRSQYVDKLESDLQQVRDVPGETPFGLAGRVTAGRTALQSGAVAIRLHSSGATSYIRSEGIDGTIAFAASSPSQVMGGASAVLSVRAFGYQPIEEELPITSGKLLCIDIALKPIAIESQSQLELNVVDMAGKPVPLTEVTLSFVGASPVWTSGSGGFSGFTEMTWTQKTDRLGKVLFPGLSSDWYKFVVGHKSLRPAVRTLFLESSQQSVQTVQLRPRRMVRIEFVSQPDGTGKFTSEAIDAEIQEGGKIPLGKNPDADGNLTLTLIGLDFFTDRECWIADLGKIQLAEVKEAQVHEPKRTGPDFWKNPHLHAECRIGHVYVLQTASKQHIKFRVLSIEEPKK